MHELSLINDLMRKIAAIAHEQSARVKVTLGAFSNISPDHFREHFEAAAATGTIAHNARLLPPSFAAHHRMKEAPLVRRLEVWTGTVNA